jgi:periplasmic divalent cation tolerance protein
MPVSGRPADVTLVLTTVPDGDTGERLVRQLVDERLAACGNLVPGVVSIYRWEGAVQREGEVLVLLKTCGGSVERLFQRVTELHPYRVPELLSFPVGAGLAAYCEWVAAETAEVGA